MEELIVQAKNGDKSAFTELVLQMKDRLYKIAKVKLKNDDDIYDVIQDTMIIAYKNLKKLKYNQYFSTWIIRILINECNKFYRFKINKKEVSYEYIEPILANDTSKVDDKIDFEFICNKLNKEDGLIILLYYMERYTDKEIGEILNMKENTVRTKRTRAKEKIKKYI